MKVHLGEAEVVGQVLARVFSSAGAVGLGVAVLSALGACLVPMQIHFTVTNVSCRMFARFRSATTTCFKSSSWLSNSLQFASFSGTPDVLMSAGVMVFAMREAAGLSEMFLVSLALLMLSVPADRA